MKKVCLIIVIFLLMGAVYQQGSQLLGAHHYPAPGRVLDVNGTSLHVYCKGTGSPTLVLEAGATGFAQSWAWIQDELSQTTRVCSYDRAGLGWSDGEGAEHNWLEIARNLKHLLEAADEAGPYIMVGHSMGGPLVQIFTGVYPNEVVGVGLIDPSHPDQLNRYGADAQKLKDDFVQLLRIAHAFTYTGLVRATNVLAANASGLPHQDYRTAQVFAASPQHLSAAYSELERWETTMATAANFMDLNDRPLAVISATEPRYDFPQEYVALFKKLHVELANMSSDSRYVEIAGADHFTVLTTQQYALETSAILSELVERVRRRASATELAYQ